MQSISAAVTEIFRGVLAGDFLGVKTTPWIGFLASFGCAAAQFPGWC